MNYKNICPPDFCTGCMACAASCNHGAIEILEDPLGFEYPKINIDKCIGCNLCYRTCPELNRRTLIFPKKAYAAAIESSQIKENASGGAATVFSEHIIAQGGIVIGCSGQDIFNIHHEIAYCINDLKNFKGSKYVQSHISTSLLQTIKKELKSEKYVLFIGTGCQNAGLQNYLCKEYDNLITVDLICHGVPSQKMLNSNIDLYKNIDFNSIKFRSKVFDDREHKFKIQYGWEYRSFDGNKYVIPVTKDPYMAGFMDLVTLRKCCYTCRYAYSSRQTDITIGDYWGLGEDSILKDSCGVSLILVNTEKGSNFLKALDTNIILEPRPTEEAICGNGRLKCPPLNNSRSERFYKLFPLLGWSESIKKTAIRHLKLKRMTKFPQKVIDFIRKLRKKKKCKRPS